MRPRAMVTVSVSDDNPMVRFTKFLFFRAVLTNWPSPLDFDKLLWTVWIFPAVGQHYKTQFRQMQRNTRGSFASFHTGADAHRFCDGGYAVQGMPVPVKNTEIYSYEFSASVSV